MGSFLGFLLRTNCIIAKLSWPTNTWPSVTPLNIENFVRLGVHGTILSVREFRRLAVEKFERPNRGQIIWPVRSKTWRCGVNTIIVESFHSKGVVASVSGKAAEPDPLLSLRSARGQMVKPLGKVKILIVYKREFNCVIKMQRFL